MNKPIPKVDKIQTSKRYTLQLTKSRILIKKKKSTQKNPRNYIRAKSITLHVNVTIDITEIYQRASLTSPEPPANTIYHRGKIPY